MTYACHFTISKIKLLFQCRVEIHRTLAKLHIKNLKMTPLKFLGYFRKSIIKIKSFIQSRKKGNARVGVLQN